MKILLYALVICFLLISSGFMQSGDAYTGLCARKCSGRCSRAGFADRCMKYCNLCCEECRCVPSGTYGNKHECPCYRDKRNSKGRPKCP
ncbi:hypothetical protein MLD38_032436 [Melastoma candidum]|uniref:Uncharacterized protein n=1 Tax=Melastoma candidum TaxID=119954 RepID=A0ACB9M5M5_9MYRT|nr:hypothetical protein MLD38_032436 [Melastoma candidum]